MAFRTLSNASSIAGPVPGPPWILGRPLWAYLIGGAFVVGAVSIATRKYARLAATLFGTLLLFYVLLLYLPAFATHLYDPGKWTSAAELLSLGGAALVLAEALPTPERYSPTWRKAMEQFIKSGRFRFAIPLLVFGIQHYLYADFVATLVPSWIPARLFWAYLVGVAFIAASVSIVIKMKARLAAILLGTMFFLWVILVHAPRVVAAPHDGKEWTSSFVALAMSGAAFVLAGTLPNRPSLVGSN